MVGELDSSMTELAGVEKARGLLHRLRGLSPSDAPVERRCTHKDVGWTIW